MACGIHEDHAAPVTVPISAAGRKDSDGHGQENKDGKDDAFPVSLSWLRGFVWGNPLPVGF